MCFVGRLVGKDQSLVVGNTLDYDLIHNALNCMY